MFQFLSALFLQVTEKTGKQYNAKVKYSAHLLGVGFQLFARIISAGASFVVGILIAYYLGFSLFGEFVKLLTLLGFLYVFVDFGLNTVFLQDDNEKEYGQLITTRLVIATILFFVYMIIVSSPFFPVVFRQNGWLLGLCLFPYALQLTIVPYLQKRLQFGQLSFTQGAGALVTLCLVYFIWQKNLALPYLFGSYLVGAITSAGIGLFFLRFLPLNFLLDPQFIKRLLKKSAPLGIMLLCNLLYFRLDVLLLAAMKSSHDIGIYGFAYKFFEFFIAIPLFLSNTIFPRLLNDKKEGKTLLQKNYFWLFLLFSICAVIVGWIISYTFPFIKEEFSTASFPFRILLLSLPFFFLSSLLQWILIAEKDHWALVAIYVTTGLLNAVLNILFIPVGSYIAAAVVTGVSECVVLVLLCYRYLTLRKTI